MIDFFEESNETSEAIYKRIVASLAHLKLDAKNVVSYGGDNAPVNYGCNNSVYQKLEATNSCLIKANCNAHVLHNCAKYCLKLLKYNPETLVTRIHSEFSSSAHNVAELKTCFQEFDSEFQEMIRHVPVRWLSLYEAIN